MKTPLQHIEDQLWEVHHLSNKENKRWADGVLQGLCEAYFSMGLINQKEWDQVCQGVDINYPTSPKSTDSWLGKDSNWPLLFS